MTKRSNIDNLRADNKDSKEDLKDKNRKLRNRVRSLERKNKILKSENNTLNKTWGKTEDYLRDVTNGVPLKDLLQRIEDDLPIKKVNDRCPKCARRKIRKIQFKDFHVLSCDSCEHRERVDEPI